MCRKQETGTGQGIFNGLFHSRVCNEHNNNEMRIFIVDDIFENVSQFCRAELPLYFLALCGGPILGPNRLLKLQVSETRRVE